MPTERPLSEMRLNLEQQDSPIASGPDISGILRRERRRVMGWTLMTLITWLITAAYLFLLWLGYIIYVHPSLHETLGLGQEVTRPERLEGIARALLLGIQLFMVWPILLVISAASSTALILISRKATLRQIQVSLAEISRQLADKEENRATNPV